MPSSYVKHGKEINNMAVGIRTDEQIQTDVLEEFQWDTRVQPNEIVVAVKDGVVTLTGWVDSYLKKSLPRRSRTACVASKQLSMTSRCACLALPNAPMPTLSLPCSTP
jgi:hypothetical protein